MFDLGSRTLTSARVIFTGVLLFLGITISTGTANAGCRVELRDSGRMVQWANFNFSGTRFYPSGYRPADSAPTVKRVIRNYRFAGFRGASEGCRVLAVASLRDGSRMLGARSARYELTGCYVKANGKARERFRAEARKYCGKARTIR